MSEREYSVDPRKNPNIPLTCKNCYLLDIWTCKVGAIKGVINPYANRMGDCPVKVKEKRKRK